MADDQLAADVWADFFSVSSTTAASTPKNGRVARAGFGWNGAWKRSDHDRAGLCLPPRIDNGTPPSADDFVIPHPRFRIDRFADCPEETERSEVVLLHPFVSPSMKARMAVGAV